MGADFHFGSHCPESEQLAGIVVAFPDVQKFLVSPYTWDRIYRQCSRDAGVVVAPIEGDRAALILPLAGRLIPVIAEHRLMPDGPYEPSNQRGEWR